MITLDPRTGQLGVSGPIDKKLLVLGMIRAAEHIILTGQPEEPPRIVPAEGPAALELARRAHTKEGSRG